MHMLKHMTRVLMVLAFLGFATARAAPPTQAAGKVVAVSDGSVQIAIEGAKPAWVKVNAPVKFDGGVGKVTGLSAEDAKPVVITVKTKAAAKLKAGDALTFDKGRSMSGC